MTLRILIGIWLMIALTGPSLAQAYTAGYGTGNVIDTPLLEKTNGRYGYGGSVAPRPSDSQSAYSAPSSSANSAYAYAPIARGATQNVNRHRRYSR